MKTFRDFSDPFGTVICFSSTHYGSDRPATHDKNWPGEHIVEMIVLYNHTDWLYGRSNMTQRAYVVRSILI